MRRGQRAFIGAYVFPQELADRLREHHPHLTPANVAYRFNEPVAGVYNDKLQALSLLAHNIDAFSATLNPGATSVDAGKLGKLNVVNGSEILLGSPFIYTKDNIKDFDF